MAPEDPYQILGVAPDASARDIDLAYRRQMAIHHPDRSPADGGARARAINVAHDLLSDPHERAAYDRERLRLAARMAAVRVPEGGGVRYREVRPRPVVPREMRPGAFDPDRREPLNLGCLLVLFSALMTVFLYAIFNMRG